MKIKIGTRGSRLALAQTEMVITEICRLFPKVDTEISVIRTKGDIIGNEPLSKIGGKGVFVSEIEKALTDGVVDIAVHSAKDLPVKLAENLEVSGVLPRGNHRDALVLPKGKKLSENGRYVIGTGSLRRRLNLMRSYPNVEFKELRGNVETRLHKLKSGEFDGIILAMAGLERLELNNSSEFEFYPFESTEFIPAACQGIIAIESRKDSKVSEVIRYISEEQTMMSFETERFVLELLGGDCTMPIGAFSKISEGRIYLTLTADSVKFVSGEAMVSDRFKLAEELVSQL